MNQPETIQRIRFEEVSPSNTDAAFLDTSILSLIPPLGLPIYEGYDGLDDLRLTFLTLLSGETVTLTTHLNSPQPGTSIHVDSALQNLPRIVFDACQQLRVSRQEVLWFHPDWEAEIDRLYAEHGEMEKRPELSQVGELSQSNQYEPIDCFNHALKIYTRQEFPEYWAMLQHNLGLAYTDRIQGDQIENLERSIECFNKSMEIYTQESFAAKWEMNQEDLTKSQQLLKQSLVRDIISRRTLTRNLSFANLSSADLSGADLKYAKLSGANLIGVDLSDVIVTKTQFGYGIGVSKITKQYLSARGAIFDDASGDRSASENLIPR